MISEILDKARHYYRSGNLVRAEKTCRQILDIDAKQVPTWFLLGLIGYQNGKDDEAIRAFREAVQFRSDYPEAHNNIGICLARQGKLTEAAESFRAALKLRPNYPEALSNLGNAMRDAGRADEASEQYARAIALSDGYAEAHNNFGIARARLGKWQQALESYRRAIELRPNYAEAHNNLGSALAHFEKLDEAIASFERALELKPAYADAHANRGIALAARGEWGDAASAFRQAIELQPRFPEAHNRLGQVLASQGSLQEAAAAFRQAIQLDNKAFEAHRNLGNTLLDLEDLPGALDAYQQAVSLRGNCPDTHFKFAIALTRQRRFSQAVYHFDQATRLRPDFAEARMHRALNRLQTGDFERGWTDYEWRWKCKDFNQRNFSQPRWQGEPVEGKRILLHTEQELGDTFQFVRYARLVKERGATVLIRAPKPLLTLLRLCPYLDGVFPEEGKLPNFDVHLPLLSLPKVFGTTLTTVPAGEPYLFADPELVKRWQGELSYIRAFKVGINWQGNPKYRGDRRRSIPLAHFAPLAAVPGVRLISLQKNFGTEQIREARFSVSELGGQVDEASGPFMDTVAVMRNLDLFITSDTALPHVAGALGIPTWMAIPYAPDWRWLLHREDCPWYPSMRLFRQTEFDNWGPIFEQMAEQLALLVRSRRREFQVSMSAGDFCDYWTTRRAQSQMDEGPAYDAGESLRHLDDLGYPLASDPELRIQLNELEETNQTIAQLRAKLTAVALTDGADPSLADISKELGNCERRRRRLIEEFNLRPVSHAPSNEPEISVERKG